MFAFAQVIPLGDIILLFLYHSGLDDGNNQEIDEVEQELRDEMEEEKLRYFYSTDIHLIIELLVVVRSFQFSLLFSCLDIKKALEGYELSKQK